jgi:FMN phosphatase YigB (HAD superfamily)
MIGDRLDTNIRPARLLGWKTIHIAKASPGFRCPEMAWRDEAELTLAPEGARTVFHERSRAIKLTLTAHTYCSRSQGPNGCSVSL